MAVNMNQQGRGWHGDPKGHARAGQQSSGKFKAGEPRTKSAAQAGGDASPTSFEPGSNRAKEAGRKGGKNHAKSSSS
jgi:general stress protein YciG